MLRTPRLGSGPLPSVRSRATAVDLAWRWVFTVNESTCANLRSSQCPFAHGLAAAVSYLSAGSPWISCASNSLPERRRCNHTRPPVPPGQPTAPMRRRESDPVGRGQHIEARLAGSSTLAADRYRQVPWQHRVRQIYASRRIEVLEGDHVTGASSGGLPAVPRICTLPRPPRSSSIAGQSLTRTGLHVADHRRPGSRSAAPGARRPPLRRPQ